MVKGYGWLIVLFFLAAPARAQPIGDIVITEVLANPGGTITDANGEWFELFNTTEQPIDLQDWFVRDSSAAGLRPLHQIASSVIVPARGFVVLGNTTNTTNNGGVPVDYAYGSALALANSLDALLVIAPDGVTVVDRVRYANAAISAQNGISREVRDARVVNYEMDGANWVDAAAATVYGPGGRGTPGAAGQTVLPVELVRFGAVADGPDVVLTWETASETNNAGFDVEHFEPPVAGAGWMRLGFAPGAGTAVEARAYTFRVPGLAPGAHRFRLRQVDYDGAFAYSPEVAVRVALPEGFSLEPAYPNPFNPSTRIPFGLPVEGHVTLKVYDALGVRVATLVDGVRAAGAHRAGWDAAGMPSGAYWVRLEAGGQVFTRKLMLVR